LLEPAEADALISRIEKGMDKAALVSEEVDRWLLFFRIVRGWSLGIRLTGSGVTVQVGGALVGFCQL